MGEKNGTGNSSCTRYRHIQLAKSLVNLSNVQKQKARDAKTNVLDSSLRAAQKQVELLTSTNRKIIASTLRDAHGN
jgi:hypothetical protein